MAKIDIPRLIFRTRRGRQLCYWNPSATLIKAGWKMVPLGSDIEAAVAQAKKLNAQVEEWRDGGARPRAVRKFVKRGTLDQLIAGFEAQRAGTLRASTLKQYRYVFRIFSQWAGPEELSHITRARVRKLRDRLLRPDKDGTVQLNRASGIMRTGTTLFKFAIAEDYLPEGSVNPFAEQAMPAPPPRQQVWSPEAVEMVKGLAIRDEQPGIALALLLAREAGQREGDLLRLSIAQWVEIPRFKLDAKDWERLAEPDAADPARLSVRALRLRQGKTRQWIEVPVVGETRRLVEDAVRAAIRVGSTALLLERRERDKDTAAGEAAQGVALKLAKQAARDAQGDTYWLPWDPTRFQRAIADLRSRAAVAAAAKGDAALAEEIRDLQFRDLRRTAVVWLAELGIEDHLIAAITGHKLDHTRKILETYLPRTTKMAGKAIALRIERTGELETDKARPGKATEKDKG